MSHCRNAGIEDLSETHALMSLDGCSAWSVARDLFGPEIPGLPYLSVENCSFDGTPIRVFRAGKTSEFGYLAMVPRATASALATAMAKSLSRHKGGLCGSAIHNDLRLEGRFFNIHAEGAIVRDPLPLGLQWMIDLGKPDFRGAHAIFSRRAAGLKNKIAGILASPSRVPAKGELVYDGNHAKGRVVASCFSHNLGLNIGLALLDIDVAYAGLVFRLGPAAGDEIKTMAMPPIMPKAFL